MTLNAMAEQAGVACTAATAYGDQAGELAALLVGTRTGELLGPLATATGWRLVQLRERVAPTMADGELLARASDELLEDALAPHLTGRVEWHAQL